MSWNNTKTPLKPDGPHKWQIGQSDGKYVLTEKDKERLRKYYPIEMNKTLMKWFGVSCATIHRFARQLGLKKKMNIIRKKHTKIVKKICEENGYYESLRGKKPSPQAIEATKKLRAEGFSPMRTYRKRHPKEYQEMIKRTTEHLQSLKKRDRRRIDIGLDPLVFTSMAQVSYTRVQVQLRTYSKQFGYIPGSKLEELGQRHQIFYTAETRRIPMFEKRCEQAGLYIDRLPCGRTQNITGQHR